MFCSEDLTVSVQRDRFSLYELTPQDTITNRYVLSLHNRTGEELQVDVMDGEQRLARLQIAPGSRAGQTINVERQLTAPSGKIKLTLKYNQQQQWVEVSYSTPYASVAAN